MIVLKKIGVAIIILMFIQIVTFYTIAESSLVMEIGSNYESYVLQFEENEFKDIGVISELNLTKEQVIENFKEFEPNKIKICKSKSDCSNLRETYYFYLYAFDFETKNPFIINVINESELAKEYGASWESKYIWIIYKWILVEKTNTGIS